MSERETEITTSGCLWRLVAMVVAVLMMLMVITAIETRDNYIRDLQRRVGELEERVKQ